MLCIRVDINLKLIKKNLIYESSQLILILHLSHILQIAEIHTKFHLRTIKKLFKHRLGYLRFN